MKAPTVVARRVALFADIHGNLAALEAVLEDLARMEVDAVLFGGDYALYGPEPAECIVRVAELGDPAIRGNTDRWLVEAGEGRRLEALIAHERRRLTRNERRWLETRPFSVRVKPAASAPVDHELLLVHANPTDDESLWITEQIPTTPWPRTPAVEAKRLLGDARADLIVYGHVHYASEGTVGSQRIASIGSVGFPFDGDPRAAWAVAVWDGEHWRLSHHRVPYDHEAVAATVERIAAPHAEDLAHHLRQARPAPGPH